ncbi:MAG: amino acid ABC transporter substrate-binding protein [Acidobacteriia bacterium]|nr:amino acid ABC transporter substrate-binding protein [Methyloceanibacter sp.]MBX5472267.1 amino acid ABC transporter substrate-binding protein [Acetobacteraceae bacterium]MCL6490267.1 amino acid ABC transporter substrate-binding protein [Terriglobia bacterium]
MTTRRELLQTSAAITLLGAMAQPRRGAAAAGPPIRVGCSITQTGPYSAPAVFELQGYQLAAAELNKAGGVLGRPIEIVAYDDQGNPSTAVQLYQKLIHSDRVDLLVSPYEADLVLAVAPLVTRARMVMPSLGANIEPYQGKYPYLIQAITQTPRYMVPVIDLAASRGYKTVALLVQNTQFPQELAKGIADEATAKGMSVVFREAYAPTTTDFSALVLKAAERKPDVIIGATYLADAMGIVHAAKAENVQAKMFAFSIGPVEPEFGKGLGPAAEGIFGTTLYFPSLKTAGNEAFVADFTAKFGRAPDYHAAVAYASLKVLAGAVQRVGSLDQDKILRALLQTQTDTVVGRFALSPTGMQTGYTSYVLQWQKGKQELVWPREQATAPVELPHPAW